MREDGEHVPQLRLEEMACGLLEPAPHLKTCADCARRLEYIQGGRQVALSSPGFEAVFEKLEREREGKPVTPTVHLPWRMFVPAFGLAAGLALIAGLNLWPEVRIKGGPSLQVLKLNGDEGLRVGDRVALVLQPGPHTYALVESVDGSGHVEQVWPVGEAASGRVEAGARTRLKPDFEVTPGSTRVWALFSSVPLQADTARHSFEAAIAQSRQGHPQEVEPPRLPDERARVDLRLVPEAGPPRSPNGAP